MDHRLEFASGADQAFHAGLYFNSVASDLVDDALDGMRPHHYRVGAEEPPSCMLRLWCYGQPDNEHLLNIVAVTVALQRNAHGLLRGRNRGARVADFFQRWLSLQWTQPTFFLEKLKARDAFTQNEQLDLSLAVLGGRLVMLSTGSVMFVRQAPGLFGMAISGHGSYLVEELRPEPATLLVRR